VDGFIAKRFRAKSELGAYLDPLADKALLVSVFVTLGYAGAVQASLTATTGVIAAAACEALLLGVSLSATTAAGAVLMFAAVAIAARR